MIYILMTSFLLISLVCAKQTYQIREWTNNEGQKIFARFVSYNQGIVKVKTFNKGYKKIPISILSEEDKIEVWKISRDSRIKLKFKSISDEARRTIPSLNQSQFGNTNNNCGPNAVANFLLWWDQNGIIQLNENDERLEKIADRVHSKLESTMRSKNGTKMEQLQEGLDKYFLRQKLKEKYQFNGEFKPATIENIYLSAKAGNMSILSLKTMKNGREDESHFVSVTSCKEDLISFNTWGYRLNGKFVSGIIDKEKVLFIELVKEPGTPIFNWLSEQGGGFFISENCKIFTLSVTPKEKLPQKVN